MDIEARKMPLLQTTVNVRNQYHSCFRLHGYKLKLESVPAILTSLYKFYHELDANHKKEKILIFMINTPSIPPELNLAANPEHPRPLPQV